MDTTKIYDEIAERGIITEREVNLVKRRMNNYGDVLIKRKVFANGPLKLTPEQNKKGIDWLLNLYKTPTGRIRKNNPFNKKQAAILENFKEHKLISYRDMGTFFMNWYPVYRIYSTHWRYFDYIPTWNQRERIKFVDSDLTHYGE